MGCLSVGLFALVMIASGCVCLFERDTLWRWEANGQHENQARRDLWDGHAELRGVILIFLGVLALVVMFAWAQAHSLPG